MRGSGLRCVITGLTDNRTTNRTTTFFVLADRNLRKLRVLLEEILSSYWKALSLSARASPLRVLGFLRRSALRRWSRSVPRPYKDSYDSSARPMGVASPNCTFPCAIATFPVSFSLSSPGDVWPRRPLLPSTRPWTSAHFPWSPQPKPQPLMPLFSIPVMPNARMSLCTQSVHSFSFPPRPLRTASSRFQHACLVFVVRHTRCMYGIWLRLVSIYNSTVVIMLPPCSSSLASSSNSHDETITNKHPRNDAACVRSVLHPLPLPLSSCLGCIPPLIGLPSLRFNAVVTSLFLLFVFSIFLFFATMSFAGYFLVRSLLSSFPAYLRTLDDSLLL